MIEGLLQPEDSTNITTFYCITALSRNFQAIAFFTESNLPHYPFVIRRFSAYQKAALKGATVYESGDRSGKIAWSDYERLGREVLK